MDYVALFFAGALLCNSIPHLVAGLQGAAFPTPFAKPRGIGKSSALVNFAWGGVNGLAGLALLSSHPVAIAPTGRFAALLAGAIALGVYISRHFSRVRKD